MGAHENCGGPKKLWGSITVVNSSETSKAPSVSYIPVNGRMFFGVVGALVVREGRVTWLWAPIFFWAPTIFKGPYNFHRPP